MTKLKKPLTLAQLRERWSEGGKKRAANLSKKRREEISAEGVAARKKQAKEERDARARELEAMHTETHTPTFSASAQG